jgi:hypothetical protein
MLHFVRFLLGKYIWRTSRNVKRRIARMVPPIPRPIEKVVNMWRLGDQHIILAIKNSLPLVVGLTVTLAWLIFTIGGSVVCLIGSLSWCHMSPSFQL